MILKKLMTIFTAAFMLMPAVFADDKATTIGSVKVGPSRYTSVSGRGTDSVTAKVTGADYVIAVLGTSELTKSKTTGTLSVNIPTAELNNLVKGYKLDLSKIVFSVSKSSVGAKTETTIVYKTDDKTTFKGTFRVVAYDTKTKVLKFTVTGKATNTIKSTTVDSKETSATLAKATPVLVKGIVTLP
jgi:hypothetical protein